jgi:hypothetical protein
MEVTIYFSVITDDGFDIGVKATATLSGKCVPATFHHDIEDDRECMVDKISFTNDEGDEMSGSDKLKEIVYKNINDKDIEIYKDAEKGIDEIYIDDFKSDHDYAALML